MIVILSTNAVVLVARANPVAANDIAVDHTVASVIAIILLAVAVCYHFFSWSVHWLVC